MSFAKTFFMGAVVLFSIIGIVGWLKGPSKSKEETLVPIVQEIPVPSVPVQVVSQEKEIVLKEDSSLKPQEEEVSPEQDRIHQLFALDSSKLPFIETVSYTSRVPWLKGRPAWIADYASHYSTSRHFIARGLNKKADYVTQKIAPGDRFNVFKKDAKIKFHLLIDLSRAKMWFYCLDLGSNERFLLKTYKVGLGRLTNKKASGCLTPLGKYELGEKIAIYKPGIMGFFQDQKAEMIRVFGTRWIPFEKEIGECTEPAKGLGIHGNPWVLDSNGNLSEDRSTLGKYDSDGCIRLASEDIEEIFSIIITKPTTVELVKDFQEAKLFGKEVEFPKFTPLSPKQ